MMFTLIVTICSLLLKFISLNFVKRQSFIVKNKAISEQKSPSNTLVLASVFWKSKIILGLKRRKLIFQNLNTLGSIPTKNQH